MSKKLISIIIPVYNVSEYIKDTLMSILQQTKQDYEVLIIDDHGTDNSIEIARELVQNDSRFRFLETDVNSGPGIARNVGIESAKGDYIAFLDSDDLWENNFLEEMLNVIESTEENYDIVYCHMRYLNESDGKAYKNPTLINGCFTPSEKKYFLRNFRTFVYCFLIRREFLIDNNLRFPSLKNSEDTHFIIRCILLAENKACVDKDLYIYRIRIGSLTTGFNPNRYKSRIKALNMLISEFKVMRKDARYAKLNLKQYNFVMWLLWVKKGVLQALREFL